MEYQIRLTSQFGLMPWDVDRLPYRYFVGYCRAIDEMEREATKDG